MDDLILRAAARDVINTWGRQRSEKVRMGLLHRDLDAIPAVDAVPVVFCKNCKYAQHDVMYHDIWCNGIIRQPEWYCADGERRDSE